MGKVKFNIEHKKVLDSFLLKTQGVLSRKMFGSSYDKYDVIKKDRQIKFL
jgi:hypothetical protein